MEEDDLVYKLNNDEINSREAAIDKECIEALEQAARDNPEFKDNLNAYRQWMERRGA